jgi:hypothetical protein
MDGIIEITIITVITTARNLFLSICSPPFHL